MARQPRTEMTIGPGAVLGAAESHEATEILRHAVRIWRTGTRPTEAVLWSTVFNLEMHARQLRRELRRLGHGASNP